MITIITTTSGCRVIFTQEEANQEQEIKESETIDIDAKLLVQRKSVIIRGKSNLKQGARLTATLRLFDDSTTMLEVLNTSSGNKPKEITFKFIDVDKGGEFSLSVPRGNDEKRYRMDLTYDPLNQSKEIHEKYGMYGEKIGPSVGLTDMKVDGEAVRGIVLAAPIVKASEGGAGGNTEYFTP